MISYLEGKAQEVYKSGIKTKRSPYTSFGLYHKTGCLEEKL
jgi:hypothetical protein